MTITPIADFWRVSRESSLEAHSRVLAWLGRRVERFGVQGSGFRVQGSGSRVQGSRTRVWGLGVERVPPEGGEGVGDEVGLRDWREPAQGEREREVVCERARKRCRRSYGDCAFMRREGQLRIRRRVRIPAVDSGKGRP